MTSYVHKQRRTLHGDEKSGKTSHATLNDVLDKYKSELIQPRQPHDAKHFRNYTKPKPIFKRDKLGRLIRIAENPGSLTTYIGTTPVSDNVGKCSLKRPSREAAKTSGNRIDKRNLGQGPLKIKIRKENLKGGDKLKDGAAIYFDSQNDVKREDSVTHMCRSDGGVFTHYGSDTKILVPSGAVAETDIVEIVQKTICDVHVYRDTFNMKTSQVFVSPIIDLSCQKSFEKQVTVFLPVSKSCHTEEVQVYSYHADEVVKIPPINLNVEQDSFYVVDGNFIRISTWHFSKYYACTCQPKKRHIELNAYVYARTGRTRTCNVRLFLCDDLHSISDFRTVLDRDEKRSGFNHIHHGKVNLLKQTRGEDKISVDFQSGNWQLKFGSRERIFTVGELIHCGRRPAEVGTWDLKRRTSANGTDTHLHIIHQRKSEKKETYLDLQDEKFEARPNESEEQTTSPTISHRSALPSRVLHAQLFFYLDKNIDEKSRLFRHLKILFREHIGIGNVTKCETMDDLLTCLLNQTYISIGDYTELKKMLEVADANALKAEVEDLETAITKEIENEKNRPIR